MVPLIPKKKKKSMIIIKYSPSNGTCQNLSPIGLLVYKLQWFKWSYCCKFSKQWKKSEFCVLIKHCFLIGKDTVQAKQQLDKSYSDSAPSETMVKRWHGHTDTNDAECSGHSNSAVVPENTKKLHKLLLANCKLKLQEIAEDLKCIHHFAWTFVHKKAVFKVGAVFSHSRSKTTVHQRFRASFATVSTQQKGVFV